MLRGCSVLHRRIAEVSLSAILRSVYISLLELIENHARDVGAADDKPLPEYIAARHQLHEQLVDAIEARDREHAQLLIAEHNNTAATRT